MKTKRNILTITWAQLARASRLTPGNPARLGARLPRVLLTGITALFLAKAALWPVPATGAENGEQKLDVARAALHGRDKDTEKAKKLLLEIVKQDKATLQPGSLCYVYVYLGYIEDRATNRTQAVAWYKKALALKDGDAIRGCAEAGLKEPMTWIRHLDADSGPVPKARASAGPRQGGADDSHLKTKVKFTSRQASVQDIVQALAQQAGLGYDRQKSFAQTDPLCRRWVNNVAIEGKPCDEALDQILDPVGLRYEIEKGSVVLYRKDEVGTPPGARNPRARIFDLGKAYVTYEQPPKGLVPARSLSRQERQENFELLWEAIDKAYADFELKGIGWPEVRRRYQPQLAQVETADAFYVLLFHMVNELKDTHSWLQNYSTPRPAQGPGLAVDLFGGKPFVAAVKPDSQAAAMGVKPGAEVVEIDGATVEERVASLRPYLPGRSSERAYERDACHYLLAGEKGSTITVKLRGPDGRTGDALALKRSYGLSRPPARVCPIELTRQQFVHFGQHPAGMGYIRIESFNGRGEVADEFDRALQTLRATPGLILDIRDNPGGFGQPHIVGRLLQSSALTSISYCKNGPGHRDLQRREERLEPSGPWQYTGPVALLVNDVTGSAADLFACWLRSAGRVVTIGSTTHGNLSGVAAFAVLPCGLVARISNGYICDAQDRPIEGRGNQPDVSISPTMTDVLNGKDPVLDKAVELLQAQTRQHASGRLDVVR